MSERMLEELRELHKLKSFTSKIENFDYIWINHGDKPEAYILISKWAYYNGSEYKPLKDKGGV